MPDPDSCRVGCVFSGSECSSTFSPLGPSNISNGRVLTPGTSCSDYKGYCDQYGTCITSNNEDELNKLENLLDIDPSTWLLSNWYIVLLTAVGVGILTLLLKYTYKRTARRRRGYSALPESYPLDELGFTVAEG